MFENGQKIQNSIVFVFCPSMAKIKILIVEDEPIIAADLERQLRKMDYEVLTSVESGEEAIEIAKNDSPDLILMDVQLEGDLDGVDTAHQISKICDATIIFLTSNTDERTFSRARLTNPHAFLSKPFRKHDLKHSIELAISNMPHLSEGEQPEEDPDPLWMNDRIFIKSKNWMVKIQMDDLLWIEADSCYCTLKTTEKDYTIVSTLKKFSQQIPNKELLRVHRSYIVNLTKVDKISDTHLSIGKTVIPIGRSYKETVFKLFQRL